MGDWKSLCDDRESMLEIGRSCVMRERVYVGDWKSLCDERESMWEIERGRVMRESLCG